MTIFSHYLAAALFCVCEGQASLHNNSFAINEWKMLDHCKYPSFYRTENKCFAMRFSFRSFIAKKSHYFAINRLNLIYIAKGLQNGTFQDCFLQ